ncbi:hypothetical protein SERLA73DRAFT_178482 [Serpula lacrymans var. lacrymans S7.3]|uniref:Uncharacterized protein n=2 Tax=Serpula lacrymans var. lacrymans TaxID=341189 RepID=F8PRQ7_SERL3|nr:hypothetical protein SERLA73DRAFT_178482 [Serpula lacrymans var. lacrymans S7.3]
MPFTDTIDDPASPTSTSSTSLSPPRNGRVAALAITVAIVGILMFTLITCLTLRLRRAPTSPSQEYGQISNPKRNLTLNLNTPLFTPSGSSKLTSETPKFGFKTTPASQLRVAHQRDNGAWDFSDPDPIDQYGPSGALKLDKHLSPPYPSPSLPPNHPTSLHEERGTIRGSFTPISGSFELDAPPPAYCRHSGGGYIVRSKE